MVDKKEMALRCDIMEMCQGLSEVERTDVIRSLLPTILLGSRNRESYLIDFHRRDLAPKLWLASSEHEELYGNERATISWSAEYRTIELIHIVGGTHESYSTSQGFIDSLFSTDEIIELRHFIKFRYAGTLKTREVPYLDYLLNKTTGPHPSDYSVFEDGFFEKERPSTAYRLPFVLHGKGIFHDLEIED